MKKALMFLFLSFVTAQIFAQSDTSRHFTDGPITFNKTFWMGQVTYTIGRVPARGKDVVTRLMSYPASAKEDNIAAHYHTLVWCAFSASVACLATSLIVNDSSDSFHTHSSKVFLGAGLTFIIPEAIFAENETNISKMLSPYIINNSNNGLLSDQL